ISFEKKNINKETVQAELEKFHNSLSKTIKQLEVIRNKATSSLGEETAVLFDGYIMLLEDEELIEEVESYIKNDLYSADYSAHFVTESQAQVLAELEDKYMQERATDMRDLGLRLVKNILDIPIIDLGDIQDEVILIAEDLAPADTAQLNLKKILGIITDLGGKTSHTSIMTRSMEIPAIVGTKNATSNIKTGDTVILDSINNIITVNPSEEEIKKFDTLKANFTKEQDELKQLISLPATTTDGHNVEIFANIGTVRDAKSVLQHGAEGIGLYRSEFLFMDRDSLPTEEEQFIAYKDVLEIMKDKLVVLRTMDIGGDKDLPYLNLPKELNPFLGWRAIRVCFDRPEILNTQLRAALRASAFGKLAVMFPMVISYSEVVTLKEMVAAIKSQLKTENIPFDENLLIGIMIETPAAAIIADKLIKEVDFFSIGTNDLTQYTLAVDRGNENISNLYNPFSPSVLALINQTIKASHSVGKFTGMCGEFASNPKAALILLGMGLNEFSMSASAIPRVKKLIRSVKHQDTIKLAEHVLTLNTAEEIEAYVDEFIKNI
ncbi:MAG: phosphoenolpyruvate-protein phosphotransferase PtsI, partial [Psittacicella sp.]